MVNDPVLSGTSTGTLTVSPFVNYPLVVATDASSGTNLFNISWVVTCNGQSLNISSTGGVSKGGVNTGVVITEGVTG